MTVRGGGVPASKPWLLCRGKEWVRRLGASPPMRMTASWSGPWTHRIQGCGAIDTRPHAGSPLNVIPTTSIGPPCSELSRHGLANAERVERLVRRPTLTAPARAGFAMLRVENEETDSRSNKETDQESKKDRRSDRLTIKTHTRFGEARDWAAIFADDGLFRATETGFSRVSLAKAPGS
jgi:hypothetical protein